MRSQGIYLCYQKNLSNLYSFERSDTFKDKFLTRLPKKTFFYVHKRAFAGLIFSLILLLGFTSVVSAQKSLPGDLLYPVKIASEKAYSTINPSFKSEILVRRSEEIRDLSNKNSTYNFYQTIDNYQLELRKNEEAQEKSLPSYKNQIQNAITETQNRQTEIEKRDVKGESTQNKNSTNSGDGNQNQNNNNSEKNGSSQSIQNTINNSGDILEH